jgi:hypothetical protein
MAILFEKTILNGMQLDNRLVRSDTWEGMCAPDADLHKSRKIFTAILLGAVSGC